MTRSLAGRPTSLGSRRRTNGSQGRLPALPSADQQQKGAGLGGEALSPGAALAMAMTTRAPKWPQPVWLCSWLCSELPTAVFIYMYL